MQHPSVGRHDRTAAELGSSKPGLGTLDDPCGSEKIAYLLLRNERSGFFQGSEVVFGNRPAGLAIDLTPCGGLLLPSSRKISGSGKSRLFGTRFLTAGDFVGITIAGKDCRMTRTYRAMDTWRTGAAHLTIGLRANVVKRELNVVPLAGAL